MSTLNAEQLSALNTCLQLEHLKPHQHTLLWFSSTREDGSRRVILSGVYTFNQQSHTTPPWLMLARWALIAQDEYRYSNQIIRQAEKSNIREMEIHQWKAREQIRSIIKNRDEASILIDPEGNISKITERPRISEHNGYYKLEFKKVTHTGSSAEIAQKAESLKASLNCNVPSEYADFLHLSIIADTLKNLVPIEEEVEQHKAAFIAFAQQRLKEKTSFLTQASDTQGKMHTILHLSDSTSPLLLTPDSAQILTYNFQTKQTTTGKIHFLPENINATQKGSRKERCEYILQQRIQQPKQDNTIRYGLGTFDVRISDDLHINSFPVAQVENLTFIINATPGWNLTTCKEREEPIWYRLSDQQLTIVTPEGVHQYPCNGKKIREDLHKPLPTFTEFAVPLRHSPQAGKQYNTAIPSSYLICQKKHHIFDNHTLYKILSGEQEWPFDFKATNYHQLSMAEGFKAASPDLSQLAVHNLLQQNFPYTEAI